MYTCLLLPHRGAGDRVYSHHQCLQRPSGVLHGRDRGNGQENPAYWKTDHQWRAWRCVVWREEGREGRREGGGRKGEGREGGREGGGIASMHTIILLLDEREREKVKSKEREPY